LIETEPPTVFVSVEFVEDPAMNTAELPGPEVATPTDTAKYPVEVDAAFPVAIRNNPDESLVLDWVTISIGPLVKPDPVKMLTRPVVKPVPDWILTDPPRPADTESEPAVDEASIL